MLQPLQITVAGMNRPLCRLPMPLQPESLIEGDGSWEVELGFGKGRYLLRRSLESPQRLFLGVEVVSKYCRLLIGRAHRQGASNLAVVRGEAVYALSAVLPRGFAEAVHVYFPDPWPKVRHHKRRLFDPERIDLVLGLLRPRGRLLFATDFLSYGQKVQEILESHPALDVREIGDSWPEGPRTNYEAKYVIEGRPILRLEARLRSDAAASLLHPRGAAGVTAARAIRLED